MEKIQISITDVNSMITGAIQRGQHTIDGILENVYRDDCNYPVTTEEELREFKEELPGFMHEHGVPVKAITCTGKQAPGEQSGYGFINTIIILQESEHTRYQIP